jgi:hypothetical protein
MNTFKVGDAVYHTKHGHATIKKMEVVNPGDKNGINVDEWFADRMAEVIVDLDNGHWGYGDEMIKDEDDPTKEESLDFNPSDIGC